MKWNLLRILLAFVAGGLAGGWVGLLFLTFFPQVPLVITMLPVVIAGYLAGLVVTHMTEA